MSGTNEDRIAELLIQWEDRWEHGEDIPPEKLASGCPELLEPLRQRISILKQMGWMNEPAEEQPAPDPLLGRKLAGRYRVDGLIAQGGFGRVYRAFDVELQRPVAVKISLPHRGTTVQKSKALLAEARKAAKLRHPGIVAVHDVGVDDGQYFLVSDLVEGESLASVLERRRPDPTESARLVAEIATALHFAHQNGFIHRDIKPQNILIDQHSNPLITDFGIALSGEELLESLSTSGTLPYMAPEQFGNRAIDQRVDVYALGVVLFELLTGTLPFDAPNPTSLCEKICSDLPPSIRSLNPKVTEKLEQICLQSLAKDPAERFRDVSEFGHALRRSSGQESNRTMWVFTITSVLLLAIFIVAASRSPHVPLPPTSSKSDEPPVGSPNRTSIVLDTDEEAILTNFNQIWVFNKNVTEIRYSFDKKIWEPVQDFIKTPFLGRGEVDRRELDGGKHDTVFAQYTDKQGRVSPVIELAVESDNEFKTPSGLGQSGSAASEAAAEAFIDLSNKVHEVNDVLKDAYGTIGQSPDKAPSDSRSE